MRSKVLWLAMAVLVGACLGSTNSVNAQQRRGDSFYRSECVKAREAVRPRDRSAIEDIGAGDSRLEEVATECGRVGADAARGVQQARAFFYSGRAYNLLGGRADDAINQLQVAVNLGRRYRDDFDLRAAQLQLVEAYREANRREAARNLLNEIGPGGPAVAYQDAMLTLAELGPGGRQGAFNALKGDFILDDAQLFGDALSADEIRWGRSLLFHLGMQLGREAFRPVRDQGQRLSDAQNAIDFYAPAVRAVAASTSGIFQVDADGRIGDTQVGVQDLADAYFELGVANLRAAGVTDDEGLRQISQSGQLDCLGGKRDANASTFISSARAAFDDLQQRYQDREAQDDANWGLGCAKLAALTSVRGAREQRTQLQEAVDALAKVRPTRLDALLTRARAQLLQGDRERARATFAQALQGLSVAGRDAEATAQVKRLRSQIYVGMARTHYLWVDQGSEITDTSTSLYTRTILEIQRADQAYQANPTLRDRLLDAERDLKAALEEDRAGNPEANLVLGHIYILRRQLCRGNFSCADALLDRFRPRRNAGRGGEGVANESEGAPEGAYLMSRRLTLDEQERLEPEPRRAGLGQAAREQAVGFATRAHNSDPANQDYRRQACLARIVFGAFGDGEYCTADETRDRDRLAEAMLYEGVFFLRRGQQQRRVSDWARAIQRFEQGYALTLNTPGGVVEGADLQQLLRYGERYVRTCRGLGSSDRDSSTGVVRNFFRRSGMPERCGI